jgi:hypothetical protein
MSVGKRSNIRFTKATLIDKEAVHIGDVIQASGQCILRIGVNTD